MKEVKDPPSNSKKPFEGSDQPAVPSEKSGLINIPLEVGWLTVIVRSLRAVTDPTATS